MVTGVPSNRDQRPGPTLVVGAAIVRHGRLLATRRVAPGRLAGGWELPGGKVEPGESAEQACVREVREELSCEIKPVRRLPGEQPLDAGFVLHVYEANLVAGEPVPHEHDAIRWLAPEELDQVGWLAADLPYVLALRPGLLRGQPLGGGNVGGAVRIGETVRRPTGPWTPTVHGLLRHLAGRGVPNVPTVLGIDAAGREVLTYLEGHVSDTVEDTLTDRQLEAAMRWLRGCHRAVEDFRPDRPAWRLDPHRLDKDAVICHNDFGAYNMAFDGDRLTGVFDWDIAGPAYPIDDLSFFAWNSLPLCRPAGSPEWVARRLQLMAVSYGEFSGRAILDHVEARISGAADTIAAGQAAGDPGMLNLRKVGEPDRMRRQLRWVLNRSEAIRAALS
jgi:8-oxo-dGTP diphosphatase